MRSSRPPLKKIKPQRQTRTPSIRGVEQQPNVQALMEMREGNSARSLRPFQRPQFEAPKPGQVPMLPGAPQQASFGGSAPAQNFGSGDWRGSLSPAESWIIQKESSFNPRADNPTSTAFGIWQGLDSTRKAYGRKVGVDPNTVNPWQQLAMFRSYVKDRYGTAEGAQRFWQAKGWY